MRKLFYSICLLSLTGLVSKTASAQIQKGNTMWGGTLSSMNFGLNSGSGWDINVTPRVGYFIQDNIALGGYINVGLSKAGKGADVAGTYGVGGFGRYYAEKKDINNILKHGRFFGEANVGFAGHNNGSDKTNGFGFGFGPGYSYFITPNVGIEGLVKYNGVVGGGNTTYTHNITFNLGFQIYLPSSRVKSMVENPNKL